MATSGRSKSITWPDGRRRKGEDGKLRAPRSARQEGTVYMEDCSDAQLKHAEVPRGQAEQKSKSW